MINGEQLRENEIRLDDEWRRGSLEQEPSRIIVSAPIEARNSQDSCESDDWFLWVSHLICQRSSYLAFLHDATAVYFMVGFGSMFRSRHVPQLLIFSVVTYFLLFSSVAGAIADNHDGVLKDFFGTNGTNTKGHTNNWAVLLCSSRYWFNYRVSSILGLPDQCA